MEDNYIAIHEASPNKFKLIILWSHMVGPHRLDKIYKSRNLARKAATEIAGKTRKIVTLKKLYQIHEEKIHKAYMALKEKT